MQQELNPDAKEPVPLNQELVAQYLLLYSMSLPQGMEINDKMDTTEQYLPKFSVKPLASARGI